MIFSTENLFVLDSVYSSLRIFIPVLARFRIPIYSLVKVNRDFHANFVEVA